VGCTVTPFDGESEGGPLSTNLWIANSPPSLASVTLGPDDAREGDTLTCTAGETSDPDGDDVAVETSWNVNGAELAVSSATLSSAWFNQGEPVTCTVTPTDGTDDGDSLTSAIVTIGNTPPVLASVGLSPAEPTESSVLSCTPGVTTDADGTLGFGYEYAWIVNAIDIGSTTATLSGSDFDRGDTVACRVTPNDGDDDGDAVTSATATVQNTAPSVGSVAISPDPAIDTDTLTCSYSGFDDADGDADSSTLQWAINGIVAGTDATLTAGIDVDDFVTCTVTPHDGLTTGAPQAASVRVGASTETDDDGESSGVGGTDGSGGSDASGGSDSAADDDITFAIADYEFVGEGSGDQSGYSVANAGDVDGDGLNDILVGAPYNDDAGYNSGKAYLFYGKTLGDRTRINLGRADYSFVGEMNSA